MSLPNVFRVESQKRLNEEMLKTQEMLFPHKRKRMREQLANNAKTRLRNWTSQKLMDKNLVETLRTGLLPLYHHSSFKFRDRQPEKELGDMNVYVRNYMPAKSRAEAAEKIFREIFLEQAPYKPRLRVERDRISNKEIGPSMHYGDTTENQRIIQSIQKVADTKMLASPSWKDVNKEKWVDKGKVKRRDFDITLCKFEGKRSKDPWPMIPISLNKVDPYKGGFEQVGNVGRVRRKELEISTKGFVATLSGKDFENLRGSTRSLRAQISEEFQKTAEADSTKKSKFYPNSLNGAFGETMQRSSSNNMFDRIGNGDLASSKKLALMKQSIILEIPSLSAVGTSSRNNTMKSEQERMLKSNTIDTLRVGQRTLSEFNRRLNKKASHGEVISSKVSDYFG